MKFFLLLITAITSISSLAQQTTDLPSGLVIDSIKRQMPYRDVVLHEDGIVVTYTFDNVIKQRNYEMDGTEILKIPGFGLSHQEGLPCLPLRWDTFVIPDRQNCSIEVIDSCFIELDINISPSKELDVVSAKSESPKGIIPIHSYNGFYPKCPIDSLYLQEYGNNFILNVCVLPIMYDYRNKKARVFSKLSYKVKYANTLIKTSQTPTKKDNYLYNTTLNYPVLYNSVASKSRGSSAKSAYQERVDYLIVSISEYSDAVSRFAEWKRLLGFNTHVEMKNRGLWTSEMVDTVIQNVRLNYPNLSYVLFVGDHQDVPAKTVSNSEVTDYLYLNSTTSISNISIGRLSVSTPQEADVVVNKVVNYEREPITASSFYSNVLSCAFFQDGNSIDDPRRNDSILRLYDMRRFVLTAEEIRNHLILQGKNVKRVYYAYPDATPKYWNNGYYSFGDEIPVELQKPNFLWNGTRWKMNDSLAAGTFCVMYNDHGLKLGWRDPWYHSDHLDYLHNGNKLPVVFSMACETGCFNDSVCFAEKFLRKADGGCVAMFAASGDGYSGYDDALAEGMIDAIWPNPSLIPQFPNHQQNVTPTPNPTFRLGQILRQGLYRMQETWGNSFAMRRRFHCFGDPSMMITTEVPTIFSNASINRTSNHISVQTGEGDAKIVFYDQRSDSIVSFIGASADYYGVTDAVSVCVSAHNKIPFIDRRSLLYMQNETLAGSNDLEADVVIAGEHVTDKKDYGEVRVVSGKTTIQAQTVELYGGTSVSLGAELEITNTNP